MKKIFAIMFISVLFVSGNAFAVSADFDSAYTVASSGSTTEVTEFDINGPAPWLYLNLPTAPHQNADSSVSSTWFFNPEVSSQFAVNDAGSPDSKSEFWLSPTSIVWDAEKSFGSWHIDTSFIWNGPGSNDSNGSKTVNFTVTPEPVSMALFGLGASALGLTRLRRKKK